MFLFFNTFYLNVRIGDPCIFNHTLKSGYTHNTVWCSITARRPAFHFSELIIVYYHVFTQYTPCSFVRHMHSFVTFTHAGLLVWYYCLLYRNVGKTWQKYSNPETVNGRVENVGPLMYIICFDVISEALGICCTSL